MFNKITLGSVLMLVLVFPGCDDEASNTQSAQKEIAKLPIEGMKKSDCFSCHFIEEPSYGPAYLKIAARYQTREYTLRDLGEKVQTGGGGLWGGAQMSRHRFLKDDEVDAMVKWVLTLNDREAALNAAYAKMPAVEISDKSNGLAVNVYPDKERLYPQDSTQLFLQQARMSGYMDQYRVDAETMTDNTFPVVFLGTGTLNIKSAGKYFFRLRGKKTGALYIDGAQIISILETDQEALIELQPGKHAIRIESQLNQSTEQVILEWIAPGDEYYSIVPAERLSS